MGRTKYVLKEDGSFTTEDEDDFAWEVLVRDAHEEFQSIESFRQVTEWLETEPDPARHMNKLVGIDERRHGVDAFECIQSFLAELFDQTNGLEYDEEAGWKLAKEFVSFFGRETIEFECLALLENFGSDTDRIDLGDGLWIERQEPEARSALMERMDITLSHHDASAFFRGSEFALRLKTEETKVIHAENEAGGGTGSSRRVHEQFSEAAVALTVFGKARIHYHGFSRIATSFVPGGRDFHPSSGGSGPTIGGQRKDFSHDEVDEFLQFLPNFRKSSESLRVGIRWLNHLLSSPGTPQDHIIRAAVVLESTLLHGDKDELRFRLRLRGGRLLEGRDRTHTYQLLGKLYDQRSNIVHEGKALPSEVKVGDENLSSWEFVNEVIAVCRDVVVTLINEESKGRSLQMILQELDKDALLGVVEER